MMSGILVFKNGMDEMIIENDFPYTYMQLTLRLTETFYAVIFCIYNRH